MSLKVGDKVRLKDWDEQGEVIQVRPDGGVWVDTDCNIYRNWSQDAFVKVEPADELLDSLQDPQVCMLDDCGCSGLAHP